MVKKKVYAANPYGFSDAGRYFMKNYFIPKLLQTGVVILDPWELIMSNSSNEILEASRKMPHNQSIGIGVKNIEMIRQADMVVAVLDGTDVDSGVAAEIGYAYGIGKRIFGYRGDFRLSSDSSSNIVNLQVETFILKSGGNIYTDFDDLLHSIKDSDT